jgi:hypothetical protein
MDPRCRLQDAAAYNTFWNIRMDADTPLLAPPTYWAPSTNFIMASGANATSGVGVSYS